MKSWYCLPAFALLAACSAPDSQAPADSAAPADSVVPVTGPYSEDNLAFSDACFNEQGRAQLLEEGQSLIERGPAGIVLAAYNLDGELGQHEFDIGLLSEEMRQRVDGAAADFFREAGVAYNVTTDDVIYHRQTDGTFCAVVKVQPTARNFAEAARAIQADLDAAAEQ